MQPMLDDLELLQVQELYTLDQRSLAEHKPPGMSGSLLQNLGRQPTRLALVGVATGPEALQFVEQLEEKYRAGDPLPFVADIIAESQIDQMVIDDLQLEEVAGKPDRYVYRITLCEFIEPVEPEVASPLDSDILSDAQELVDDLVEGLDLGLDFATGLERFIGPLSDLLSRLRQFNQSTGNGNGG